jgi:hypothetical protein
LTFPPLRCTRALRFSEGESQSVKIFFFRSPTPLWPAADPKAELRGHRFDRSGIPESFCAGLNASRTSKRDDLSPAGS